MIKCRFECTAITEYQVTYVYTLSPVFGDEVNRKFWESTPSGNLTLSIVKDKGKLFDISKVYTIDIAEVS